MAIRSWHAGQLAVFWAGTLLIGFLLFSAYDELPESTTKTVVIPGVYDTVRSIEGPVVLPRYEVVPEPHPVGDFLRAVIPWFVLLVLPSMLLVVTWKWFGARRST